MNEDNEIICPNCGFSDHLSEVSFCQNCGNELHNYCSNSDCELNSVYEPEYSSLPCNAKYCPYCGSKTTFFDFLNKPKN